MLSIRELLLQSGSDKAHPHNYGPVYDGLFPEERRQHVDCVLELGVAHGCSLLAWREAFPGATVVGLDIGLCDGCPRLDRMEVHQGDQRNQDLLVRAAGGREFDLVVDDASHVLSAQLFSLFVLWPFVKRGGHYVVEELDRSPGGCGPEAWRESAELLFGAKMVDCVAHDGTNEPLLVITKG